MKEEKGIVLKDGRLITTFKELEGEFLKISTDYEFIKMNFEFTDNALRNAKNEIVALQTKLENDTKRLKSEISWLKQINKGLIDLSMEVLRNRDNEM